MDNENEKDRIVAIRTALGITIVVWLFIVTMAAITTLTWIR